MAEEEVCICGCCPSLVVSLDSPIGEGWEKKDCKGVCTDCAIFVRSVWHLGSSFLKQRLKAYDNMTLDMVLSKLLQQGVGPCVLQRSLPTFIKSFCDSLI